MAVLIWHSPTDAQLSTVWAAYADTGCNHNSHWIMCRLSLTQACAPADLVKLRRLAHLTSLNLAGAANLSQVVVRAIISLSKLKALDLSSCPSLSHPTLVDLSR